MSYPKLYKSTPKVLAANFAFTQNYTKVLLKLSQSTRRQLWFHPKLYKSTPKAIAVNVGFTQNYTKALPKYSLLVYPKKFAVPKVTILRSDTET